MTARDRYVVKENESTNGVVVVDNRDLTWAAAFYYHTLAGSAKARAEALAAELNEELKEACRPRFYVGGRVVTRRTVSDRFLNVWVGTFATAEDAQEYADWLNDKEQGQ